MVCEYIDTLKISMYGLTKDVYEKVHSGSLKHEQVLNNIDSLLSIPRNKRPYIIMLLTVVPENEHQIEEWKNYWEPKVDEIMIWLPHNFGGGRDYGHLRNIKNQATKPKTCARPFKGNYFVRANGEVSVCCFDYNHQLIIGDLKRSTLKEILLGEALQKIQRVHKEKSIEQSDYICKNCDQIYPREHALLYSSNSSRNAGVITSHSDLINILTSN
jgi:radical SAM protein with 4Fe4S-binding SPASM domain